MLARSLPCAQYHGLVAPEWQTHASLGSGYLSIANVACVCLLKAKSKRAWASRVQRYVKASPLGLVISATAHELIRYHIYF